MQQRKSENALPDKCDTDFLIQKRHIFVPMMTHLATKNVGSKRIICSSQEKKTSILFYLHKKDLNWHTLKA